MFGDWFKTWSDQPILHINWSNTHMDQGKNYKELARPIESLSIYPRDDHYVGSRQI